MTLTAEQIKPGIVAILEPEILLSHHSLKKRWQDKYRAGPFVCVHAEDGEGVWFSLTSQYRDERLGLHPSWLKGGSDHWRGLKQYLTDARKPYICSHDAVISASKGELDFGPGLKWTRPRITEDGVRAIVNEVLKYTTRVAA